MRRASDGTGRNPLGTHIEVSPRGTRHHRGLDQRFTPDLIESDAVTTKPSATGLRPASMGTANGRYLLGFSRRHDVRTGSSPAACRGPDSPD